MANLIRYYRTPSSYSRLKHITPFGASAQNGSQLSFSAAGGSSKRWEQIGITVYAEDDSTYELRFNREEAQRVVDQLTAYLAAESGTHLGGRS
jgi:hypothetical protein